MTSTNEDWDDLSLTQDELYPMQSGYRTGGDYDLWQIADYMAYPFSAAKRLLGDHWTFTRWHRDTAIAFVRFILASRGTVEARGELDRQLRAEELRSELAKLSAAK